LGFLVGGLIILAILLAIFNIGYFPESRRAFNYTPSITKPPEINETLAEGWVGLKDVETYRIIDLGNVDTSYMSNEIVINVPDKDLFSGLLFGSNSIKIHVTKPDDFVGAYLEFDISDTNSYGRLTIKMNNKVIENKVMYIGHYKVPISQIDEETIIKIEPESSLWKLWAPTTYYLRNIKLVIQRLKEHHQQKPFIIYENEFENLTRGWIDFNFDKYKGTLIIYLNGNEIYNDIVTGPKHRVMIDKDNFVPEENLLEFRSGENSNFTGTASLTIWYFKKEDLKIVQKFTINRSKYESMENGIINFRITQKRRDGGISLKLNGKQLCIADNCYPSIKEKSYRFYFDKNKAKIGENILELSAIDNGLFMVRNLTISV